MEDPRGGEEPGYDRRRGRKGGTGLVPDTCPATVPLSSGGSVAEGSFRPSEKELRAHLWL